MDPAAALRRIAYLLEASRAESYRVRAFRNAARAVDEAGKDRVADLTAKNRLQDLAGIGARTAVVVEEALRGVTPAYLERLEAEATAAGARGGVGPAPAGVDDGPELAAAAAELRLALDGDCHSHTDWSDGGSPLHEMAEAAVALGHRYLAVTDHSPRLTVAHGLDRDRLLRQLDLVAACNRALAETAPAPMRILTGIEVDILEDGSLDQDDDLLGRLDLVVASVHSKLRMDGPAMTRRMLRAVTNPHTDVLGHCTGRIVVGRGRPPSTFDAAAVFEACAEHGTAVEINSRPERLDPPGELLALAVAAGCCFAIDTDAHAPGQLEWLGNGCWKAAAAGITADRVVNAWPLDDLRAWTATS